MTRWLLKDIILLRWARRRHRSTSPTALRRRNVSDPVSLTESHSGPICSELFRVAHRFWRERVGIEPTSRLATASPVLKTGRATRPVRSHGCANPYISRLSAAPAAVRVDRACDGGVFERLYRWAPQPLLRFGQSHRHGQAEGGSHARYHVLMIGHYGRRLWCASGVRWGSFGQFRAASVGSSSGRQTRFGAASPR